MRLLSNYQMVSTALICAMFAQKPVSAATWKHNAAGSSANHEYTILGMFAIREERDYCIQEDFMKAVRKVADAKKLESKLDYEKI